MHESVRILSFYLPQYHPIPENDEWWGKGFTEWTNTAKARPLYRGHHQPNVPADLGFYDLRLPEAREAQAILAKTYGIHGFAYWHYWFGDGRTLLEKPFLEIMRLGKPDLPFCMAWANQTWTGTWHGLKNKILIQQTYPGREDEIHHFHYLLPAFHDPRYIRVHDKPVFIIFNPESLPDSKAFTARWNEMAIKEGLPGIYFIGIRYLGWDHRADGFNAKTIHQPIHYLEIYEHHLLHKIRNAFRRRLTGAIPLVADYGRLIRSYNFHRFPDQDFIPSVVPNWDNTPRSGRRGYVFQCSTPELFRDHLRQAIRFVRERPESDGLLFIKSWNEWAEGNYLEPDLRWGHSYLQAVRDALTNP